LEQFDKQLDLQPLIDYYAGIKNRKACQEAIISHGHPIIEQAAEDLRHVRAADLEMFDVPVDADSR
jgi:hypothetical protein